MVKIKICGNTNYEHAKLSADLGADYLGFIFTKNSKRTILPKDAYEIIKKMPYFKNFIGVFYNQSKAEVEAIIKELGIKHLQFHGEETSRYCDSFMEQGYNIIKTFHIRDKMCLKRIEEYNVTSFLFDTYSVSEKGGTGLSFDWNMIEDKPYVHDKLFLAGGLNPQNVRNAIKQVHPFAVDVASGVEKSPGQKDPDLLKAFFSQVKKESFHGE